MATQAKARAGWDDYKAVAPRSSDRWASSDRGWLFAGGENRAIGHYLDYGANHYRSGHEYCRAECTCERSQPGHVHAVVCSKLEGIGAEAWRYFETVEHAKEWIETYWARKALASARTEGGRS